MTRIRNGKQLGQHLTAKNVYTLPAPTDRPNFDYMDPTLPGFSLRVSRGGKRMWTVRYTVQPNGERRRWSFAECRRDEKGLTLSAARDKAAETLRKAEEGIDPLAQRQEQRKAQTFAEYALESYLPHHARAPLSELSHAVKKHEHIGDIFEAAAGNPPDGPTLKAQTATKPRGKRSWREDQRIIENELIPAFGSTKLCDLTRDQVLGLIRRKALTAPVQANRIGDLARHILNCAIDDELIDANVVARFRKEPEQSRERVLTDAEIAELWPVLSETAHTDAEGQPVARLNEAMNDALKFDFLTASRSGAEAVQARWPDIDLIGEVWEIPGEFTKNGRPHRVPLTAPAMEIIARRLATARPTAVWIFEHTPGTHVGARLKKACAFLCKGDAHLSRRRKGAKGPAKRKQRPPFQPALSFPFWRHDLRRTAATWLGEANVADETISRVLNHKIDGPRATPTYNRAKYDAVKRAALEVVARRLEAIISGQRPASNVVAFAGAR